MTILILLSLLLLPSALFAQRYPTPQDTATHFNGLVRMPSGVFLASTGHGIFRTLDLAKAWTQIFPTDGRYVPSDGLPLARSGNIVYFYQELLPAILWTSGDDGQTWTADTLVACNKNQIASFYIDEFHTKHAL